MLDGEGKGGERERHREKKWSRQRFHDGLSRPTALVAHAFFCKSSLLGSEDPN